MAGLFGIGGSAAKTDRGMQLKSWGDLQSLFAGESKLGGTLAQSGAGNLGTSANYWQALLSGDPTKMSQALAPQISAIKGQSGQTIAGLQQFGDRSGGTSAAVQSADTEALSAIQNLFDLLGPEAATQLSQVGGEQLTGGAGLLGEAGTSASNIGQQATGSRETTVPEQQAQQAAVIQTLSALMGLA